jgi:hypothetical protein
MAASKACCAANLGLRKIQVDVRTSDFMAGAGGRCVAGPAPVRSRTSDTSQKVLHLVNVLSSGYIPRIIHSYHQRVHDGGVVV